MPDHHEQFDRLIVCPGCNQIGVATWEESGRNDASRAPGRSLLYVSFGFHAESGRTQSGDPSIVWVVVQFEI